MFALLPPGGRLVAHRDPCAGSLRYHLGLVTPNADTCKIFIDGEPYFWKDGEDVLFDETYIHYAENKSDVTRMILFCDVERPMTNGLVGKQLKAKSRFAYYAVKYAMLGGLFYWIFLT
jgi:beta-hydroxylase